MDIEDLTKQRIDYEELPNGGVLATLTVTLNDGSVHRFTEEVTEADVEAFAHSLAIAEADAVEGFLGDIVKGIGKGIKKIGGVAKKIVTSKVFQGAAAVLGTAALGPAGLAAAGALSVASKLATADVAKKAGAGKAAAKLVKAAKVDATKRAKGNAAAAADLLRIANLKRQNVANVIARSSGGGSSPSRPTPLPSKAAPSSAQILAAAKAGRLRSNRAGSVSKSDLLAAAKSGRVFWAA